MTTYTLADWKQLSEDERLEIEKRTLFVHLEQFGLEAAKALLKKVEAGRIDGGAYCRSDSGCGCILGTLAIASGASESDVAWDFDSGLYHEGADLADQGVYDFVEYGGDDGYYGDACYTMAEILALRIRPGNTPDNCKEAKLIADWTREWIASKEVSEPEPEVDRAAILKAKYRAARERQDDAANEAELLADELEALGVDTDY